VSDLIIDDNAVEHIRKHIEKENTEAVRLFIGGGGCCERLEIAFVEKALAGDVTYERDGVKLHVEKALVDNTSAIEIKYDEQRGLLINLLE
jgi:Fe-S cluster assembly iron-binding protein IscA